VLEVELDKPLLCTSFRLLEGFWPSHDWKGVQTNTFMLVANVEAPDNIPKDEQPKPYCRPFNKRLEQGFNP
jgi:hypothetical protein